MCRYLVSNNWIIDTELLHRCANYIETGVCLQSIYIPRSSTHISAEQRRPSLSKPSSLIQKHTIRIGQAAVHMRYSLLESCAELRTSIGKTAKALPQRCKDALQKACPTRRQERSFVVDRPAGPLRQNGNGANRPDIGTSLTTSRSRWSDDATLNGLGPMAASDDENDNEIDPIAEPWEMFNSAGGSSVIVNVATANNESSAQQQPLNRPLAATRRCRQAQDWRTVERIHDDIHDTQQLVQVPYVQSRARKISNSGSPVGSFETVIGCPVQRTNVSWR